MLHKNLNGSKPVDLKDEDPDVLNEYMNCVYVGQKALEHFSGNVKSHANGGHQDEAIAGLQALIRLYLFAEKLQDLTTANMVIDEIMRFSDIAEWVPDSSNFRDVYDNTTPQSTLRRLMRDYWLYEMSPTYDRALHELPVELMQDILGETLRIKDKEKYTTVQKAFDKDLSFATKVDICRYHQHDDKCRKCAPKSKSG